MKFWSIFVLKFVYVTICEHSWIYRGHYEFCWDRQPSAIYIQSNYIWAATYQKLKIFYQYQSRCNYMNLTCILQKKEPLHSNISWMWQRPWILEKILIQLCHTITVVLQRYCRWKKKNNFISSTLVFTGANGVVKLLNVTLL